ncbi:retrotransposon protein, putative, ty1-copia subclass [Tanacetum coccineum]
MVLRVEKKLFVIEHLISPALPIDSTAQVLAQWNAVYDAHNEVSCLMLGSMTPELHRQLKNSSPYEMLQELKSMFNKQAGVERNFVGFVRNYNMHNMGKTIGELHALLIEYEKGLPKKAHPTKDDACYHCKEVGYYKRNCPAYLAEVIKKKKQVSTASFLGLRGERKLKQGALYLCVGNGVRAQVEATGTCDLVLPNGLAMCLDNCHYAPTITRGVVSVSRLVDNGFI